MALVNQESTSLLMKASFLGLLYSLILTHQHSISQNDTSEGMPK